MKPSQVGGSAYPRRSSVKAKQVLAVVVLEDRVTPATLTPDQVRHAYGLDAIPKFNGTITADGKGQTIAIVDAYDDPNIVSDAAFFNLTYGTASNQLNARPTSGPGAYLKVVNQNGGSALPGTDPDRDWEGEIALDVEWAHVFAPMADIILVECDDAYSLDVGVTWALQSGATVISNSWGSDEYFGETNGDGTYTNPNGTGTPGVAILFSAGDSGVVSNPSSSPNVLSIGATDLYVNAGNTYGHETAWSYPDPYGGGGGGGASYFESRPSYQDSVQSVVASQRGTPDVSAVGGFDSPLSTYETFASGGWSDVWGTSASCPMWAGLVAVVDQGRAAVGLQPYNTSVETQAGPNLTSYQLQSNLYALASNPVTYAADFHDVTIGRNAYGDRAQAGYDLATGLGTPVADKLVPDLIGYSKTALSILTPVQTADGNIQLTATVSGPMVTPTGTVAFKFGSTALGTAKLVNGKATLSVSPALFPTGVNTVTADYLGDANYTTSSGSATATFQPVATTTAVTATRASLTYGQSVVLTAAVVGTSGLPSGAVTFKVGTTVLGTAQLTGSLATLTVTGLPAGSDAVTAYYAGTPAYLPSTGTITETVAPAPLTVTAAAKAAVYGGAVPALTYAVSGLVNGDTAAVLTGALASAAAGGGAGTYPITQGTLAASSNYALTFTGAAVTIAPAQLKVTADAKTAVYGAAVPALTYAVSGLVNGDTAAAVLAGAPASAAAAGSPAGAYPITQGTLAVANANYALAFVGAAVTITPAPLTVFVHKTAVPYGEPAPTLSYDVVGLVDGDTADEVLSGSLATAVVPGSDVRAYPITQGTLRATANYALTVVQNTLSVTPDAPAIAPDAPTGPVTTTTTTTTGSGGTTTTGSGGGTTGTTKSGGTTTTPVLAPVATADAYTTTGRGPLAVSAAAGVLANDTDPNGRPLTAVLVSGVPAAAGTLALNADGSFTFTPKVGFTGATSFTYAAADPLGQGGPVTVALTVPAVKTTQLTAVAAGPGAGPRVTVYNPDNTVRFSFFAYEPTFTGGVTVATGDVDGDGVADIITAPDSLGGPVIRVFSGADGHVIESFLAYAASFRGGVNIAAGDVTGDGLADIITGAGAGGGPHVQVFDGATGKSVRSFFAYDSSFRGGVTVAAGDVTGDGVADIVTGVGAGGGPQVNVYDGKTGATIQSFFAYDPSYTGGLSLAVGDVNGDGRKDVVAATSVGTQIRAFDGQTGSLVADFNAGTLSVAGGTRVAVKDTNGDGVDDVLLVATGPGGSPDVVRYALPSLAPLDAHSDFPDDFNGGLFIG